MSERSIVSLVDGWLSYPGLDVCAPRKHTNNARPMKKHIANNPSPRPATFSNVTNITAADVDEECY
jgi:hypothetical protein